MGRRTLWLLVDTTAEYFVKDVGFLESIWYMTRLPRSPDILLEVVVVQPTSHETASSDLLRPVPMDQHVFFQSHDIV